MACVRYADIRAVGDGDLIAVRELKRTACKGLPNEALYLTVELEKCEEFFERIFHSHLTLDAVGRPPLQ